MSFAITWLDLREPADHAARDKDLLSRAINHVGRVPTPAIVDLGAGTGSTVRAFGLPGVAWTLVDADAGLLDEADRRLRPRVAVAAMDLRDVAQIPLTGARLVTASALLDLTSAAWIDALAERLGAAQIGIYAALSYDGNMAWSPADPHDAAVTRAFNAHQRSDKGFGPALGPAGADALVEAMRARGFRVWSRPSPWRLGAAETALQEQLLRGIAAAAADAGYAEAIDWLARRLSAAASAVCTIGHTDVLALPARSNAQSKMMSVPRP